PIFVVPAMNTDMFENPATQENIQTLKNRGVYVVDPDTGFLAEGYEGKGRFPENERILEELENFIMTKDMTLPLRGYKILISAGGTKERIDPVRYITNDSSGKMGHAIAKAAYQYGAEVTLVTASNLEIPKAIHRIQVDSAKEMYEAIDKRFEDLDVLIMAAAVSDYGVTDAATSKMKKEDRKEPLAIKLQENPDILKTMGAKKKNQFLVGFAAETHQLEEYALKKLTEKNLDLIVANEVGKEETGFDSDDNHVVIFTKENERLEIPKTSKTEIARHLLDKIIEKLDHHS